MIKKINEIPTTKTILERLNIKDAIIIWDALNTQKKNIESVVKGKADYCVPIKLNHPVFYHVTWFENLKKWKNLKSFACVKKTIGEVRNKKIEYRYYISSLLNDVVLISGAIRHHWSVENKLHGI